MPIANDAQMQAFCDQRIRPRAQQLRQLLNQMTDDKNSIGDEYARATSATAWADARTDGPPHLLQSGNSANPDDLLNYNALITSLLAIINGTGQTSDMATVHANWSVLMNACVQPAG